MKKLFILIIFSIWSFANAQTITTVAGNGSGATTNWTLNNCSGDYGGDGSAATSAAFDNPTGVAVDGVGNIYITDGCNQRIRIVNTSGIISTIAGNGSGAGTGTGGYSGDGGSAIAAELNYPRGITIDGSGNIYFADYSNHRVRKINSAGIINTIAGNGSAGFSGDGGAATAAQLNLPTAVAVSRSGNIYISDVNNASIRKISTSGTITIAVNGVGSVYGIAVDDTDNIYFADESSGNIWKANPLGIKTLVASGLNHPFCVAIDISGNIYVADAYSNSIKKINASGIMTTIAGNGIAGYSGDGGSATAAKLNFPEGIAIDASGNIYIAEFYNQRIRKVASVASVNSTSSTLPSVSIFPNPASSNLYIKTTSKIYNVELISLTGQILFSQNFDTENVKINIEVFSPGLYFLKINNQHIEKFVKE